MVGKGGKTGKCRKKTAVIQVRNYDGLRKGESGVRIEGCFLFFKVVSVGCSDGLDIWCDNKEHKDDCNYANIFPNIKYSHNTPVREIPLLYPVYAQGNRLREVKSLVWYCTYC